MTDASVSAPRPKRRWGLILSLCLNVFLIAVVAAGIGAAYVRAGNAPGAGLAPREIVAMLEGESRAKVQSYMWNLAREARGLQREVRVARGAVFAAFQREPFDKASFEAEMGNLRTADAALDALTHRAIAEIAAMLTPAERAMVARKIRQSFLRRMLGRDAATGMEAAPDDAEGAGR